MPPILQNLTNPDWRPANPEEQGTAIIWLRGPNEVYEQLFVPGVTLRRTFDLAQSLNSQSEWPADAFRWVPDQVETIAALVQTQCGGRCNSDLECVNSACRCIKNRCRRK